MEKGNLSLSVSPCPHTKERPRENSENLGCLPVRKRALTRNQVGQYPDFGLLVSRTMRGKFLLFKSPRLWCFVMAGRAGERQCSVVLFNDPGYSHYTFWTDTR